MLIPSKSKIRTTTHKPFEPFWTSCRRTIRLDSDLQSEFDEVNEQLGRTRSDVVRDALRRQHQPDAL